MVDEGHVGGFGGVCGIFGENVCFEFVGSAGEGVVGRWGENDDIGAFAFEEFCGLDQVGVVC